ncbi:MAG: cytidylate kinase family protein [Spirochaetia bacterium]|nr:cytidylate kinase family protein [Spirochaetia bacterium]
MAIITIARQEGSLSKEIAQGLAERFGCQYVAKDTIKQELAGSYGITEQSISKYDEKKPGLIASLTNTHDKYNNYFKLYFLDKVVKDPKCILLGRGGAFFLKGVPGVLRIRIVGSENIRVSRIMERYNLDEKAARKMVTQVDNERSGYTRFFYNMSWDDPSSYDLVINTDQLSTDVVYSIVEGAISAFNQTIHPDLLLNRLKELYMAQKIIIKILYEDKLPVHFLDVDVHGDKVTLLGTVEIQDLGRKTEKLVSEIEGVGSVDNRITFVNSYPHMV